MPAALLEEFLKDATKDSYLRRIGHSELVQHNFESSRKSTKFQWAVKLLVRHLVQNSKSHHICRQRVNIQYNLHGQAKT